LISIYRIVSRGQKISNFLTYRDIFYISRYFMPQVYIFITALSK